MPKLLEHEQDFWNVISSALFMILATWISWIAVQRGIKIERLPIIHLIILTLATFRLIRLFTYDDVTGFLRNYLANFSTGARRTLFNLIDCPWCSGAWIALIVTYVYVLIPGSIVFFSIMAMAGLATYLQIIIWKVGWEPEK